MCVCVYKRREQLNQQVNCMINLWKLKLMPMVKEKTKKVKKKVDKKTKWHLIFLLFFLLCFKSLFVKVV